MRELILLRGDCVESKSRFVQHHQIDPYTIGVDQIRLMFQAPQLNTEGSLDISNQNEKLIRDLLISVIERRMQQGDFTIVDDLHMNANSINQYKKLAIKFRYRVTCIDFTDSTFANNYEVGDSNIIPQWVQTIKPEEYGDKFTLQPSDFSHWKKIHHIGDTHGCYTVLKEYLQNNLREDELYIFCGDYIDRGVENAELMNFLIEIMDRDNILLLEGNHEIHLWKWANDEQSYSRVFEGKTRLELENGNISKKDVKRFYRKLCDCVFYQYDNKIILVSHGGMSAVPSNLMYISSKQFIHGVKGTDINIDELFLRNTSERYFQIHGHRNPYGEDVQVNERCFNLVEAVEYGGCLRVVTLDQNGFQSCMITNKVYKPKKDQTTLDEYNEI